MKQSLPPSKNVVYFPGLNGVRFIAALTVIITHVELIKDAFNLENCWNNIIIFSIGDLGLYFFYVLSGFLITYLLIEEKNRKGKVSIRKFYWRRVLRIWPLYYLIVILGFFVLPHFSALNIGYLMPDFTNHFATNLWLYLLILPNVAFSFFTAVPHIGQMWSVGVEEQFYLFWPWLIKYSKNILRTLVSIFLGIIVFKVVYLFLPNSIQQHSLYLPIKRFLAMSKMELMAVGGIGAYFLYVKNELFLGLIFNKWMQVFSYLLPPFLIFITPSFLQDGVHILYSVFFLIIIMNIGANPNSFVKLDNKFFDYFGKITYGIYLYHLMIIPICLLIVQSIFPEMTIAANIALYILVIVSTLGVAALSFRYFEKPFINYKKKFEVIKTETKPEESEVELTK